VPDFRRMFLKLKYITQNTYIRRWTVTEIMVIEKCGLLAVPRTVPVPRDVLPIHCICPSFSLQPGATTQNFVSLATKHPQFVHNIYMHMSVITANLVCTAQLPPHSKVLLEMLTVPQLVQQLPTFYDTWTFITQPPTCPYPKPDQVSLCPPIVHL